jgi:hypothetical protein
MNTSPEIDPELAVPDASPADLADGLATEAALAYATAIGVFEVIDRFRFSDPGDPIPAPSADDLPDEIHGHALQAIQAAATAHLADDDATAQRAYAGARNAANGAVTTLWRLARIGLGVAQHAHDGDDVELVERAMVAVLFPPDDTPARFERMECVGRIRANVSVELAGVIAQVIIEQSLDPDTPIGLAVGAPGSERIRITITPGAVLVDDDEFPAPVTIVEVTARVLSRLVAADPSATLTLRVRRTEG